MDILLNILQYPRSNKIREFHRPKVDFEAPTYFNVVRVRKSDYSFEVYQAPVHKKGEKEMRVR